MENQDFSLLGNKQNTSDLIQKTKIQNTDTMVKSEAFGSQSNQNV